MNSHNLLPTLVTNRLILRAVSIHDIPLYQKHFSDYEVIQHLAAQVPWPYPEDGVKRFLENFIFPTQGKIQWLWGIFEKEKPMDIIGAVHLWREGKPENRGFWVGKKYWGKGFMTEAVTPVIDYAFYHLGFEKLVFTNAVGNSRSARVKEKTGAKLVDQKPAQFVNSKYTEHEIWELQKEDWKTENPYIIIDSDKDLLKVDQVHQLLANTYWAKGIPKEIVARSIENSICFGIYQNNQQFGFARVVTDKATFAWICDVIIDEKHRGQGLSKELMRNILQHPGLQSLRRICLATKDAHGLYTQFNFKITETPQNWMEIKDNDTYLKLSN